MCPALHIPQTPSQRASDPPVVPRSQNSEVVNSIRNSGMDPCRQRWGGRCEELLPDGTAQALDPLPDGIFVP